MKPLIAVVGTNASGKSALGVELALRHGGEVISADSRQVFRGLDLGSGKITRDEMRGVPHHLLDVCDAGEFFSMADYQRLAYAAVDGIHSRGRLPFLVGGTGLYVDSVTEGYIFSDIKPDLDYRNHLETFSTEKLYRMLSEQVPGVQVDAKNRNRVMRMLEKLHDGDSVVPRREPRWRVLKLGVRWDKETLTRRIDERLEARLGQGMIEEVARLLDSGVSFEFLDKLGLEYRYIARYLTGAMPDRDRMLGELSLAIKRFAKRQMTWFRRDPAIRWLDMTADPLAEAEACISAFLREP